MKFFVKDPTGAVKHIRHVFDTRAPLKEVPGAWLQYIEPHVIRLPQFKDCWMWAKEKGRDAQGNVLILVGGKKVRAKRFIAQMFVDTSLLGPLDWEVVNVCMNRDCVNPHHLQVRTDSGPQRAGLKLRDKLLAPSEYYTP